jgi:hypothetical protein
MLWSERWTVPARREAAGLGAKIAHNAVVSVAKTSAKARAAALESVLQAFQICLHAPGHIDVGHDE